MLKVNNRMVIMTKAPVFLTMLMLLALTACTPPSATKQYYPEIVIPEKRVEAPIESPPVSVGESTPKEGQAPSGGTSQVHKTVTTPSVPAESPAVLALVQEADDNSASGQLENAAATLERAIRIQPRNALLWQKLAEVRLKQNQPGLAEDLAKKSNVMAKDNKTLVGKNWTIIAEARRQKGDVEGAVEADAKAKR